MPTSSWPKTKGNLTCGLAGGKEGRKQGRKMLVTVDNHTNKRKSFGTLPKKINIDFVKT